MKRAAPGKLSSILALKSDDYNYHCYFRNFATQKKASFVSFETLLNWSSRIVNADINGAEFTLVGKVNLGFFYYVCSTRTSVWL